MSRLKKSILHLASILLLIGSASGNTHTNKTFLSTKSPSINKALEYSTWHNLIFKRSTKKFPINLQATVFHQESTNKENLGNYFGAYSETDKKIRDFINVIEHTTIPTMNFSDIDIGFIIKDASARSIFITGALQLRPSQKISGVTLDYFQGLKDFFFQAKLPIVNVENRINTKALGTLPSITAANDPRFGQTVADFFKGKMDSSDTGNAEIKQRPLTHAKFADERSEVGISDLTLAFGYKCINRENKLLTIKANGIIPISGDPDGEYLFEPMYGSHGHWGLGGGFDGKLRLIGDNKNCIEFLLSADLNYLFEGDEKRTLGVKSPTDKKVIPFGHYYLVAKKGGDNIPFPLANVSTIDIDVEPGLQFESLAALLLKAGKVTLELGYSCFAKQSENVGLKDNWEEGVYGIIDPTYDGTNFNLTSGKAYYNDKAINKEHLDIDGAKSPSCITHKIYAALGYLCDSRRFPYLVGVGASFEFTGDNSALEGFAAWAKVGIQF